MSTPSHPGLGDLQPVPASPCCCRETPQSVYSHGNVTNNHPVGWFFGPVGSSFGAFSVCALHWSRCFLPRIPVAILGWQDAVGLLPAQVPQPRYWGLSLAYAEGRLQAFCHA